MLKWHQCPWCWQNTKPIASITIIFLDGTKHWLLCLAARAQRLLWLPRPNMKVRCFTYRNQTKILCKPNRCVPKLLHISNTPVLPHTETYGPVPFHHRLSSLACFHPSSLSNCSAPPTVVTFPQAAGTGSQTCHTRPSTPREAVHFLHRIIEWS